MPAKDVPQQAKPFPYYQPMDGQQQALSNLPLPVFYPGLAAFVAVAGLAGSIAGKTAPGAHGRLQGPGLG